MKLKGGYQVPVYGKPAPEIKSLPVITPLNIPLFSKRFKFDLLKVSSGDHVCSGQIMAEDTSQFSTPLLAPWDGKIDLDTIADHIVLHPDTTCLEQPCCDLASESISHSLQSLGIWPFICNALTGDVVDPSRSPSSIIVPAFCTESFLADPQVFLLHEKSDFLRGLQVLTKITSGKPVIVVMPQRRVSGFDEIIKEIRAIPKVKIETVPSRYPFDNHKLLARFLLSDPPKSENVWFIFSQGVCAVARAFFDKKPFTNRTISTGGPGFTNPGHLSIPVGYPTERILRECGNQESTCLISGGVLGGVLFPPHQQGIDIEIQGITSVPKPLSRDFLSFANPGFSKSSYSRVYLSLLRPSFKEHSTTSIRGERRACVSCGFCEDVCPARLLPFQLQRYAKADMLEDLQRLGIENCVKCGLCTYVCPSKRDVVTALGEAQIRLNQELYPEETASEPVAAAY